MSTSPRPFTTSARPASSTACSTPSRKTCGVDSNPSWYGEGNRATRGGGAGTESGAAPPLSPAAMVPLPVPGRTMNESDFIAALRGFASNPAARGLLDGAILVLTHDMIVEGVHFLPDDPPGDVAWKLLAVNLSDLAAKGARPVGALLGYTLGEDEWDRAFAAGLKSAMQAFGIALLGGDTVSVPAGALRSFGLTAIGEAEGPVPSRGGADAGDYLWASGTIGDA